MGIDVNKVLYMDDLVKGDDAIFAATGVTDGELLNGVQFKGGYCETHSLVMRSKSGTIRFVEGRHSMKKKPNACYARLTDLDARLIVGHLHLQNSRSNETWTNGGAYETE